MNEETFKWEDVAWRDKYDKSMPSRDWVTNVWRKSLPNWMQKLSTRTINALQNGDVCTKQQAIDAINCGRLLKLRNFGKTGQDELCKVLAIELPKSKMIKCPCCGQLTKRENGGDDR